MTGGMKKYSFLAVLIGALMLAATIFLPFATATEDYEERLEEYSDEMYVEEINMTNEDAINISLFEFVRIYSVAAEMGMSESVAIACTILIAAFGVFAVLTLLFSLLKKPLATIIFNLLAFAAFSITKWDFEDRGVLPSSSYDWGMAQYICYVGAIVVLVGAAIFWVFKKQDQGEETIPETSNSSFQLEHQSTLESKKKKPFLKWGIVIFIIMAVCIIGSTKSKREDDKKDDIDLNVQLEETKIDNTTPSEEPSTETTKPEETEKDNSNNSGMNPDFKASMDSYEEFVDEYVAFMKKYAKSDGTDLDMLNDYVEFMSDYDEMYNEISKWGNKELNAEEMEYYIDVQTRVNNKLLEVAY